MQMYSVVVFGYLKTRLQKSMVSMEQCVSDVANFTHKHARQASCEISNHSLNVGTSLIARPI